jgi:hypothetical protein
MFYLWFKDLYDYYTDYALCSTHNPDIKKILRENKKRKEEKSDSYYSKNRRLDTTN